MNTLQWIIYTLAVWRVSSLLVHEEGPLHIFKRLRESAGITHDENGVIFSIPDTFLGGVLSCVWCSSIWVGFLFTVLFFFFPILTFYISLSLSLSAVAIIVDKRIINP